MVTEGDLVGLAERLQERCLARGITVATAESCTGGLVGHAITGVPGSSAYFRGAIVAYADAVKIGLLRVPPGVLAAHGAVSAQVAIAMAAGGREAIGTDLAASITGIAGPDGGSPAKPVGLTYVAVAGPQGAEVRRYVWAGDRTENKLESAAAALGLLLEVAERISGPATTAAGAADPGDGADPASAPAPP
jgi:nicotinamide-nucleotide amidase